MLATLLSYLSSYRKLLTLLTILIVMCTEAGTYVPGVRLSTGLASSGIL